MYVKIISVWVSFSPAEIDSKEAQPSPVPSFGTDCHWTTDMSLSFFKQNLPEYLPNFVSDSLFKKNNVRTNPDFYFLELQSKCRAFKLYCNFLDCFFVCLKNVKIRSTENQSVNQPSNLSVNHYSVRRLMIKSLSVNVIQPVNRHKTNGRLLPFIILW